MLFLCTLFAVHAAEPAPAVAEIRDELAALDALIDTAHNYAVQRELHRKVDRIEALLAGLEEKEGELTKTVEPPAEPAGPVAADAASFGRIKQHVEGESFSDGKLRAITLACRDNWFTAAQAAEILDGLSFGKDQVEAGKLLYPRLVDRNNVTALLGAIDFDSDKRKLSDWIAQQP